MNSPLLEFEKVCFQYKKSHMAIIEALDFQVQEGELVSIIGPSGSGKSTLFRLISGLEQPDKGSILLQGQRGQRVGKVGYMPQQDLLLPWRTVIENAILPLELQGLNKRDAKDKVLAWLDDFGLRGTEDQYPGELSGGMRQRVSFLRSLLSGSKLLLLDEPFSALDAITRLTMQEWLLKKWQKWQRTIIFITHDVDEALFLSDRIFLCTTSPIRELHMTEVPLTRPRTVHDLYQKDVVGLKRWLIAQLRKVRMKEMEGDVS